MKQKKIRERIGGMIIAILLLLAISIPLAAFGVSYPPSQLYHKERHDRFVKGGVVYLFHSGTAEVRKAIHVSDMLTVYHIDTSCEVKEVGKIRVLSYIGETYLKCEVVEGEIKPDDIAKKGTVSCLVISAGMCGE